MSAISPQQRFSRKPATVRLGTFSKATERWAVILAGGDGTRLQSMTRAITGDNRPKQFVPVIGGSTLLHQTRRRVALSVRPDRTLFVVTEKHRRFYQPLADAISRDLLLEQPENKGTAPAILYALLRIAVRSPQATIAIFPSDHYFSDDEAFMSQVDLAFNAAQTRPETVTLLGITPSGPEVEYGWIEPHAAMLSSLIGSITRVRRFWEKPNTTVARKLMERGCLWNSFVMVGRIDSLLKMTYHAVPQLFQSFAAIAPTFGGSAERPALQQLYSEIPEINFSHEVLAKRPGDLAVMRVGEVGWSDLGEPARVLATMARIGVQTELVAQAG